MTDKMFEPLTSEELTNQSIGPDQKPRWKIINPAPENAPPMNVHVQGYGAPVASWAYRNADGGLVGYIARYENANGKVYRPVVYCDLGDDSCGWRAKGFPGQRPLYRLDRLHARPDAPILVVEGEKAADAAEDLFPQMEPTTPPHGAQSPHKANWSVVRGRVVVIAPDNDDAGDDYADRVYELVTEAGASKVMRLASDKLGAWVWRNGKKVARDGGLPSGWDIADARAEGWTRDHALTASRETDFLEPYEPPAESNSEPLGLFRLSDAGVEKRVEHEDKSTGEITTEWRWFCSPLKVLADARSRSNEDWGRLLEVVDRDGNVKEWSMPMSMLASDGSEYRNRLLSLGLTIAPSRFAKDALNEYIAITKPTGRVRCIDRVGWSGDSVVLPHRSTATNQAERIIFQTDASAFDNPYQQRGSLKDWQENVARYAVGNSRLTLALSAAFAGPLLYPSGTEGGGFHFRGGSSTGKTTSLLCAGSVWGNYGTKGFIRAWRATSNGLESVSALHSDTLLCLDELGQVDGREAGQIAYMLANGQGKSRANRSGLARKSQQWRVLFLSSGELSLADKIAEDGRGRRTAAGQEVRIVDIPADAGAGMGIFEDLHGFETGDAFARHLCKASTEYYGEASERYLDRLTEDVDAIAPAIKYNQDVFLEKYCPPGADGQVSRVAARFGLVAAGGEMATGFGILPWKKGDATEAAVRCFRDWLDSRGGVHSAEEREAIAAVREFISIHGGCRFESLGVAFDAKIQNRAGYRRDTGEGDTEFFVLRDVWRKEVCCGLDSSMVAKTLQKRGLLISDNDGRLAKKIRLPGIKSQVRCYGVSSSILSDNVGAADV